jgi:gliding motility-associated-like protein
LTSAVKVIKVEAPIPGVRYPTKNLLQNTPTTIQARQIGIGYKWLPNSGISNPTISNPVFNYNQQIEYKIEILTASGCRTVDTLLIQLFSNSDIFVPNAFTPNGDGWNDRMYPIVVGVIKLNYFRIFNRWGHLVFQTADPDPARGWDGQIRGNPQPLDTYTWTLEAVDSFGKLVRRNGNFVLIR